MLKVVHDEAEPNEASGSVLDEIVREAARQMLAVALQAEVSAYIDADPERVTRLTPAGLPRSVARHEPDLCHTTITLQAASERKRAQQTTSARRP
jgi:hypothetical protein